MTRKITTHLGCLALLLAGANTFAADTVLFADDFESGALAQWTSKPADTSSGAVVADPLNSTNRVLTFTAVKYGGDAFTVTPVAVQPGKRYILRFDFLGLNFGVENGAFLGVVPSPAADPTEFTWMASTYPAELNAPASAQAALMADGTWQHYAIDLTELISQRGLTNLHLVLEDWAGQGSIPGDVFFDNIQLVRVDEEPFDLGIFDQLVPCAGPAPGQIWRNHGQYVSTMAKTVEPFLTSGIITEAEADLVISTAAQSGCGKK